MTPKEYNEMKLVFEHSYGEESYGLVYQKDNGEHEVYEIPSYGGEERHCATVKTYDEAVNLAKSFT